MTASDFGAFTLVYVGLQLGIVLGRASANMPMMIKYGASESRFTRSLAAETLGMSMAVGLLMGVIAAVIGSTQQGSIRSTLFAAGVMAPGLVLQDSCVFLFYSRQRPQSALTNNLIWLGVQVGSFLIAAKVISHTSAWQYLSLWGISAYIAVGVSLIELRTLPHIWRVPGWFRRHRSTITDLSIETAMVQASQQGVVWVLGIQVDLASVAGFRAASVPFGVIRVFIQGLMPMGVAEGVRLLDRRPSLLLKLVHIWATAGVLLSAVVGAVLLSIPDSVGTAVLGSSWRHAIPILLPISLAAAGNSAIVPALAGLRALDRTRASVKLRGPLIVFQFTGVLVGASTAGLVGAAVGFATASILGAVLAMVTFHRNFNSWVPGSEPGSVTRRGRHRSEQ